VEPEGNQTVSTTTLYERLGGYDASSDEKWRDDALTFTATGFRQTSVYFFRRHACMKRVLA
jgi:hypothetical protein